MRPTLKDWIYHGCWSHGGQKWNHLEQHHQPKHKFTRMRDAGNIRTTEFTYHGNRQEFYLQLYSFHFQAPPWQVGSNVLTKFEKKRGNLRKWKTNKKSEPINYHTFKFYTAYPLFLNTCYTCLKRNDFVLATFLTIKNLPPLDLREKNPH